VAQNASSRARPRACRREATRSTLVSSQDGTRHAPLHSTIPAKSRQRPLGPHRARVSTGGRSEDRTRRRPKVLPASSYIPRCQRRAPGLRAAIGLLEACRWDPLLHGRDPTSVQLRPTRRMLFTSVTCLTSRPLTPVSPAGTSSMLASPARQPMPLRQPPRERRRPPTAPDVFHQPAALLRPSDLPGCCHSDRPVNAFSPLASRLGLGPRETHQPQPVNLVWT